MLYAGSRTATNCSGDYDIPCMCYPRSPTEVNESCVPVFTIRCGSVHNHCHDRSGGVASSKAILICFLFGPVSRAFPLHAWQAEKFACHMRSSEIVLYSFPDGLQPARDNWRKIMFVHDEGTRNPRDSPRAPLAQCYVSIYSISQLKRPGAAHSNVMRYWYRI